MTSESLLQLLLLPAITLEEQPLMGYETLVSVSASFVFGFFTPPGFGVTILGRRVFFLF
jgi:hypothetical protein